MCEPPPIRPDPPVTLPGRKKASANCVSDFEYYATSGALYSKLPKDLQLPEVRNLQRTTKNVNSWMTKKKVFSNIEEKM